MATLIDEDVPHTMSVGTLDVEGLVVQLGIFDEGASEGVCGSIAWRSSTHVSARARSVLCRAVKRTHARVWFCLPCRGWCVATLGPGVDVLRSASSERRCSFPHFFLRWSSRMPSCMLRAQRDVGGPTLPWSHGRNVRTSSSM